MSGPRIFAPDYYARMGELEERGWWNAAMRDVAAMLLEMADLPTSGSLLDVGCGSGHTIRWFEALRPEWRVFGLDLAMEGLAAARRLGVSRLTRSSALHLPHRTGSVDLVTMLDVLQHLPLNGGDVAALREVYRVLVPRGILFVRTNAQAVPRCEDDFRNDFHRYEPGELRDKLRRTGFRVLRLSRLNALLGLAEIPRELRAAREDGRGYHGILAEALEGDGWRSRLKRGWLRLEGRAVGAGLRLPLGRSIVALCRATEAGRPADEEAMIVRAPD